MSSTHEHKPGDPAPATGHYEELNVFGSHTGKTALVTEGEPLRLLIARTQNEAPRLLRRGANAFLSKLGTRVPPLLASSWLV
jgi:hypothetical protein